MIKKKTKGYYIRLSEAEAEVFESLAFIAKVPPSAFGAEVIKKHLRATPVSDHQEEILELTKETREALKRLHEGLCYSTLKLLQKESSPTFKTDKEAHEWTLKNVGRRE